MSGADPQSSHPSTQTLAALVHSRRDAATDSVLAHLDGCAACRRILAAAVDSQPALPGPTASLQPGQRLGRYELRALLGVGAMGAVYEGFDAQLDRRVALKLLRADATHSEDARAALLAEARLMARVNHPNVRAVYDAGTDGERTFLVLELVDGQSLSRWLTTHPRWRDVALAFLDAGKGLEAAHQAGLVHRDFKASNVLVDAAGRIRVTDFGLALSGAMPEGELAGTLAFMAPEQRAGRSADARSDQFSFCTAFDLELPPDAPAWLRELIARGRSLDPAQRFPAMGELLAALSGRLSPRSTRPVLAAGALLLVLLGGAAIVHERRTRCAIDERELHGAWDAATRTATQAAFSATKLPFADAAFARVAPELDAFAQDWLAARRDACEDTRLRDEQPQAMLTARGVCLERRRAELAALSQLFTHADRAVVEKAADATAALTRAGLCDTLEELALEPAAPTQLPAYAAVVDALVTAKALHAKGDAAAALQRLDALAPDAATLAHPPTDAQRLLQRGQALAQLGRLDDAAKDLDAAVFAADRGRAATTRVEAWIALLLARLQGAHLDSALDAAHHARAALDGLPRPAPLLAAQLDLAEGRALRIDAKLDDAIALFQRARALAGDDAQLRREAELGLGTAYSIQGKHAEAIATLRDATAAIERINGAEHPNTALALASLGAVYFDARQHQAAVDALERAIALRSSITSADDRTLLGFHTNLGLALKNLGRFADARAHLQLAADAFERLDGPDAARSAFPLDALANVAWLEGHPDQGLPFARHAVRCARTRSPTAKWHFNFSLTLVDLLFATGQSDAALQEARATAALADAPGVAADVRPLGQVCLADALWRTHHLDDARKRYEQLAAQKLEGRALALTNLGRARLLAKSAPAEALALALAARPVMAADDDSPLHLKELDQLIASLQAPARRP
ncbi:MAG: serine/threonine-protein kinase [Myxococcaceae bacterium]|nr:serine/threonine-protein kinase [Myxococcaceae bacterium]